MKLIIMTKSTFFVEEDKIITTLFAEGMDKLHLCKPNSAPLYSERLLSLIPEDCYRKIVVHDHFYLKDEYGLGGIHIEDATAALPNGYKGHFSRSCSAIEELNEAKKKSSYVFLRTVFGNQAKGTEAAFSEEELKKASKAGYIDKKVFAIGGINIDVFIHKIDNIFTKYDRDNVISTLGPALWPFDTKSFSNGKDRLVYVVP